MARHNNDLHLFVGPSVNSTAYHVNLIAKEVYIKPYNPDGRQNMLRVSGASTIYDQLPVPIGLGAKFEHTASSINLVARLT